MERRSLTVGLGLIIAIVVGVPLSALLAQEHPAAQRPPAQGAAPTQQPTTQPASGPSPHMELDPKEFKFGEIWQGSPAKGDFTIKNTGEGPLTIDAKSSCGCTVATKPKTPLAPGETTTFTITYNTSHQGVAHKTVTLTTNDPAQKSVIIPVEGSVKPLFAVTPAERIAFSDLEPSAHETQTIKLENKYGEPLKLKIKEGQNFGQFEISLNEVEAGKLYELTATTKPPLPTPSAATNVIIETGFEKSPTIMIPVTASVPARVSVMPQRLYVYSTSAQPTQQIVRVQFRAKEPLKVTEVKPSSDAIKCELLPTTTAPAGAKFSFCQIRVTLPPFAELPEGAKLEILTDDKAPEYQKLELPIVRQVINRPTTRPTAAQAVRPPGMPVQQKITPPPTSSTPPTPPGGAEKAPSGK